MIDIWWYSCCMLLFCGDFDTASIHMHLPCRFLIQYMPCYACFGGSEHFTLIHFAEQILSPGSFSCFYIYLTYNEIVFYPISFLKYSKIKDIQRLSKTFKDYGKIWEVSPKNCIIFMGFVDCEKHPSKADQLEFWLRIRVPRGHTEQASDNTWQREKDVCIVGSCWLIEFVRSFDPMMLHVFTCSYSLKGPCSDFVRFLSSCNWEILNQMI